MSADEHLSPTQFGFHKADYDVWDAALLQYRPSGGVRKPLTVGADIHTGQDHIDPTTVAHYAAKKRIQADHPIEVYHHEGQVFLGDGHHRVAAARQRKQKTIMATHYGLDT